MWNNFGPLLIQPTENKYGVYVFHRSAWNPGNKKLYTQFNLLVCMVPSHSMASPRQHLASRQCGLTLKNPVCGRLPSHFQHTGFIVFPLWSQKYAHCTGQLAHAKWRKPASPAEMMSLFENGLCRRCSPDYDAAPTSRLNNGELRAVVRGERGGWSGRESA